MKKVCRSHWDDDESRASCQTDSGPPLTSHRTNVSYANPHCAICNYDFDASNDHIWPPTYSCYGTYNSYDALVTSGDHNTTAVKLTYTNSSHTYSVNYSFPVDAFSFFYSHNGTLGWLPDLIALTRYESHSNGDFNESKQYYLHQEQNNRQFSGSDNNFTCTMDPFTFDERIMRRCSDVISTCASGWADRGVEAMCLAYTDKYCNGTLIFRNPHCALCNHVDLFKENICVDIAHGFGGGYDFSTLVKLPTHHVTLSCDFLRLLKWGVCSDTIPDPRKHNATITRKANEGKLIYSYERA
jgi:hypothetical protein